MGTPTVNYSWVKPTPGADGDVWGLELNSDLDGIDSVVHTIDTTALRDAPASGGPYARQSGGWVTVGAGSGTITGVTAGTGLTGGGTSGTVTVALSAPVSVANGGTGATTAAAALTNLGAYPAANPSGYLTDAPTTGGPYGRQAGAWATISSGASLTVSDTAPASPTAGQMWFDSVGAQTYLWYTDPNSSQWVPLNNPPSPSPADPFVLKRSQFSVFSVTASGATSLSWANGEVQQINLAANSTISVSGWPMSGNLAKIVLDIKNQGAFNITGWPTGTLWVGGTAPTITSGAGKQDVIILMSFDGGTSVLGSIIGQGYA